MCDHRENLEPCLHASNIDNEQNNLNKFDAYSNIYTSGGGAGQGLAVNWAAASPAYDQTMNQLNKVDSQRRQCPDILRNITDYPPASPPPHGPPDTAQCACPDEKCRERLIPSAPEYKELNNGGPWKSKDLGELVPEDTQQIKKRRRQRKLKKGLCWLGWVFCFPVYCLCWALREAPVDEDDLKEDDCYPCYS